MPFFFSPSQCKIHNLNLNIGQWDSGTCALVRKVWWYLQVCWQARQHSWPTREKVLIFPWRWPLLLFVNFFFFPLAVTDSPIATTQNPCNTSVLLDNPPATVQKPVTSGTVLERGFRHQIWESRAAPGRREDAQPLWGRRAPAATAVPSINDPSAAAN